MAWILRKSAIAGAAAVALSVAAAPVASAEPAQPVGAVEIVDSAFARFGRELDYGSGYGFGEMLDIRLIEGTHHDLGGASVPFAVVTAEYSSDGGVPYRAQTQAAATVVVEDYSLDPFESAALPPVDLILTGTSTYPDLGFTVYVEFQITVELTWTGYGKTMPWVVHNDVVRPAPVPAGAGTHHLERYRNAEVTGTVLYYGMPYFDAATNLGLAELNQWRSIVTN